GPNVNQGNYRLIDGFGRPLEEWVSTGSSGDPQQPYYWQRTRVVVYDDLAQPQRVTDKRSQRPYNANYLTEHYTNHYWSEVRTEHDGAGRVIRTDEWNIDHDKPLKTMTYRYSESGNLVETRAPDPSVND